jgi:hypothetical protein
MADADAMLISFRLQPVEILFISEITGMFFVYPKPD